MTTTTEVPNKKADISGLVSLKQTLKPMNKTQLIAHADEKMSLNVDSNLSEDVIREQLLKIDLAQRNSARAKSEEAAKESASGTDPLVNVVFRNLQSMNEDIKFSFSGPKGVFGPKNKKGHKKIPVYHLFPGMEIELPYSVLEHLRSRVFTRHVPVYDNVTGHQSGVEPVITPRFILEQRLTREQAIALQNLK